MSLFDNVRNKPITSELKLMVALMYGNPRDNSEYLERLPDAVVMAAYKKLDTKFPKERDVDTSRQILGLLILSLPAGPAAEIINETLYEYHMLLS